MRAARNLLYVVGLMLVIAACAQIGLVSPQTPEQKIAAGRATATAINQATTQMLNAKKISSDDAQNVQNSTRAAEQGFLLAQKLVKVDPKSADAKIQAQQAILGALQAYLKRKGG